MKAAQIDAYGDARAVVVRDIPIPVPEQLQVLVQVKAASLNPFDSKLRSGAMKGVMPVELPMTLGGDIAGSVIALGAEISNISPGDMVYGQASAVAGNSGAFAEYAATKGSQLARMPRNLTTDEAASLPLVGVSALQALTIHLKTQAGQRLFISGGAGGIGRIAIQIAKHRGLYVATTATGSDIAHVKQLGADEVIDYKIADFTDTLHHFDAVYDTVGGNEFHKALHILKKGGTAVSMVTPADETRAATLGVTASMQSTRITTAMLDRLTELVEQGIVTPRIGAIYPLEQVSDAFTAREAGAVKGKIILRMQ